MGIRSYVRDRKQVNASRAEVNGAAGYRATKNAMGRAIGWTDWGNDRKTSSGSIAPNSKNNQDSLHHGIVNTAYDQSGVAPVGQGHVNVIPGGSKKRTESNSDRYTPGE